jgi:hypothetical protein
VNQFTLGCGTLDYHPNADSGAQTRAGLDAKQFAGHSLRSGFLTSAAAAGKSIFKMMDQSRHKSVETLRGYIRDAELFKNHAGTGLL